MCLGMLLQVTVYRRVCPELPERGWAGPCGMFVKERLLVPNHGKDGAVFFVSTMLPTKDRRLCLLAGVLLLDKQTCLWSAPVFASWLLDSTPGKRIVLHRVCQQGGSV